MLKLREKKKLLKFLVLEKLMYYTDTTRSVKFTFIIIQFSGDTFRQTKGIVGMNVVYVSGNFQRAIQIIGIIGFIFIR